MVNKGSDALQYLLFERYLICFLALLTLICLIIILPTNLQGNAGSTMIVLNEYSTNDNLLNGCQYFNRRRHKNVCQDNHFQLGSRIQFNMDSLADDHHNCTLGNLIDDHKQSDLKQ